MIQVDEGKIYSVKEIAYMLDCSARNVRYIVEEGLLESFRLKNRGHIKITGESLKRYMQNVFCN